jgi:hypothetical protein
MLGGMWYWQQKGPVPVRSDTGTVYSDQVRKAAVRPRASDWPSQYLF